MFSPILGVRILQVEDHCPKEQNAPITGKIMIIGD
jgi:hypothetical protein